MSIASLYPSINPSLLLDFANSKVLDPRITFTRTTTATYYDGVTTAVAEQNLLTYSQEFDNASWTKGSVTVTANSATVAPDGTTTADLFYPSSTGTWRIIYKSGIKANIQYTLTVYAKASGFSNFFVGFDNQTTTVAWFNLTTGVKGTKGSSITSSDMTSVGNGWYRCQVVFTHTSDSFALFGVADADNSSTATASGTNGALIWGAQAEQRSSATAYTATTTQAITNYIPVLQTAAAGQARFDHNPTTGESLGLLIEEARTNSLTYSAQFDNAAWTKSNATITANTIVAPDGTLTGDKFVEGSGASQFPQVTASTSISASTAFTLSIYAKAAERNWLVINANDGNQGNRTWFNLSTGVVGTNAAGTTATITPIGNGWYRCTASRTTQSTVPNTPAQVFQVADADGSNIYTGNGFSGLFIWGAQLEISGSFATSYIPTAASSVTRNADAASMTGTNFSSWFNNGEGTVYDEIASILSTSADGSAWSISAGSSSSNVIWKLLPYGGTSRTRVLGYVGSTLEADLYPSTTFSSNTPVKSATCYEANNYAISVNGLSVTTDTSANVPVVDRLYLGANGAGAVQQAQRIKKFAYYPQALTAANLQALTV